MKSTSKNQIEKKRPRKRGEDKMDTVYNYIRELEEIPSKYPLLPEGLVQDHRSLIRKSWETFDSERDSKGEFAKVS